MTEHPEDLPWNDAPADSDSPAGPLEPDPAEVVGDIDDARDLSGRPIQDPNQRETLDQRLAEEEPELPLGRTPAPEAPQLMAGETGEDEIRPAEADTEDPARAENLPAEEAALHVVDDDRV